VEYPSFDLTGQTALVTGASRGIGHDLAEALAHAGAHVLAGVRSETDLEGAGIEPVELDVRDRTSVEAAVERAGRLDILVNNAGLGTNHDALDATEEEWDELMAVNLKGAFTVCQVAGRHMVERGYGRIVNMSSQAAQVGIPRHAAYSASKAGLEGLTRVLALEWGPHNVTVNAVAPTFIRTPGTAERLDDPAFLEDVVSRIPVGRVGTTTEVAAAVIFLASPAASLVNGTTLAVDGGWTAQ
jgi:NAD(P)-dependent dehydrogenase (short-subunit alcohol dehydrogenase family)